VNVLFVCTGNMHRSPLAEALLRAEIDRDRRTDIEVTSAGTMGGWAFPAVGEAVQLAAEAGLDISSHRSRQATVEMIDLADLVLVMERFHLEWIQATHPAAAGKCRLLSEYADPDGVIAPGDDVPDAIGEEIGSFRRTFGILSDCVGRFYRSLPPPPEDVYTRSIEDRFRLRRRTPLTLSPADYELACSWWQQGIPLWIVIESIDELFRKKDASNDPARVRRLSWCARAVEARFAEYQRALVPASSSARHPDTAAAAELLADAAARLGSAADAARAQGHADSAAIIARAAAGLLAQDVTAPRTTAEVRLLLHDAEESLLGELRLSTDPAEMKRIRDSAATSLAGHRARMTPTAFAATLERLVSQELRALYDLPDLTAR